MRAVPGRVREGKRRKIGCKLRRGGAVDGIDRETADDHAVERGRHRCVRAWRARRRVLPLGQQLGRRRRLERPPTREQLVQDDAERIDVGRRPNGFTSRLFGCEIGRRAEDRPRQRVTRRSERTGDSEVSQLRLSVTVEQDVLRLQVAVHEPGSMRGSEGAGDLRADGSNLRRTEPPAAVESCRQRLAVDELHDDERAFLARADVEDLDDVRVRTRAARRASRRNRSRKDGSSARCRAGTFTATERSSDSSKARNTVAMPPAASRRSIR